MSTTTDNEATKLRAMPFTTINAKAIAKGFYAMFDQSEKDILRFGMLPAEKMRVLEDSLRQKYESLGVPAKDFYGDDAKHCEWFGKSKIEDMIVCEWSHPVDNDKFIDCNVREAVSESVRMITLELYEIGDLVV